VLRFVLRLLPLLAPAAGLDPLHAWAQQPPVDFVRDVQPILSAHCYDCHGPDTQENGLRLSRKDRAFAGGDSGQKAIVPGKPDESRLLRLVSGKDPDQLMPPEGEGEPLTPAQIETLARWISEGAPWPDGVDPADGGPSHWAWSPPRCAELPAVNNPEWVRNAIDACILHRLEQEGLAPSHEADRYTLLRRLYLDLIGIPPSPAEVEVFAADLRPDAYDRVVDRLLAHPAFGERWARPWLDLARYADSKGYGSDPLRTIWRYRDWVVEALNANLPYDQFTERQLAGDLLEDPTSAHLLATAFHRNTMANDEGGTDDEEFRVAAVKDRAETTMQVWMGLTLGCAKCHSHKYDPLSQREYYQFYAFFNQTEDADRGDEEPRALIPTRDQEALIDRLDRQLAESRARLTRTSDELTFARRAWEAAVAAREQSWTVLEPAEMTSANGTALTMLGDGSILASGAAPDTDVYTVSVSTDLPRLTAVRLELLPDDTLPQKGPGRAADGTAAVSNLLVTVVPRLAKSVSGRYVRIELPGNDRILHVAELEVFSGQKNVAQGAQASQSSTAYDAPAGRAVDGNTGGEFGANSVTHTATEADPWLEVDLGQPVTIDRIAVWNRTDGEVGNRISPYRLVVLDAVRNVAWESTVSDVPRPSANLMPSGAVPVGLSSPSASVEHPDGPAAKAIDLDGSPQSAWVVSPGRRAVHATFVLATPAGGPGGLIVKWVIEQNRGAAATMGRFRLWGTSADPPPGGLPADVEQALSTPEDRRSDQEAQAIDRAFRSVAPELEPDRREVARLESELKAARGQVVSTPILRELPPDKRRKTTVMIKGNFLAPGDEVGPAVPAAFPSFPSDAPLDRRGLARWLTARDNPLTARVAVNRLWAQLFGQGIVVTEEDFGTQGLPPTHPELLDHLAVDLMENGWDLKAILRTIVTSSTYRQSSAGQSERDPDNRLYSRGPRGRLEAEMVRDQALATSGLLCRKIGGPSVYPPQPDGLWRAAFNGERTWATSTGGDRYRRGLYTFWRRTVPYPSMSTFDAPSREICTLRRIPTNTPLQAFVTLNDPVYVECAQALARRMLKEGGSQPRERAAYGLRLALCRPADDAEVDVLVQLAQSELDHFRGDPAAAEALATEPIGLPPPGSDHAELAAWTVVANVLLNLDGVLTRK
jgi:mono/diheme cytochrome c family protein